ncbi:PAS domain-containing protein [Actinoplanes sp. CA-030573]|uniref:PAS domain-containing protein n=1 Tax=Actinoplanes sp. CA-030573 TaxID=3239898 RepID=UPI003D916D42
MSRAIEWILLGAASFVAIIAGVRWHRPTRLLPWLLLAGSIASLAIGDIFYALDAMSAADACYLAMFVLVAGALLQFTRGGSLLVDRARLIDLLAFACSTLLVVWVFVIGGSGQIGKISAADVIGDLLLTGVAARLVFAAGRNIAASLLLAGAVGMLVSDVVYPLSPGPVTEAGYIVLYVTWGLAALHPSMTHLTLPMSPRPTPWRGRWAALLGAAVATPPVVLLIEALSGTVRDGVVIAVAGALTLLMAITRLSDSILQNSQAASRERALRTASGALVAAADPPAVEEAVHAAVAQLMPGRPARVVFTVDGAGVPPASASPPHERSWLVGSDPYETTLVCPLWLEPMSVARPSGGALILTARREVLTATRDALEVLAGQAALALDRISLVEAVGRRDSDQYLRTVIGNTAELMLVIDDDQRIRYASPAVHELLGEDPLSPLATLGDLVHPDDRDQVRRAFQSAGDGTLFCSLRRSDESQILIQATYRDLREDRLVRGYVLTLHSVAGPDDPVDRLPHRDHVDELPAWVNRRSAQHKFRY